MAKRVAVLLGGWSAEREVSLVSGRAVADALRQEGFDVSEIDVTRDARALITALTPPPDVAFNALHGKGGEDGVVQGLLELLAIPYTHSGVAASALAMDKSLTKRVLETVGIRSPEGVVLTAEALAEGEPLARPFVIKPASEGSSVGVSIVREGDRPSGDYAAWPYGEALLVESYIPGRELTVGVIGDRALTVTEITHGEGFFDYEAKYTSGRATHTIPADAPAAILDLAKEWALLAHRTLGCAGVTRSDFRWDDNRAQTEGLYFLEINTQPGLTPISLVPEQAEHTGLSFSGLCRWLVETAQCHA